MSIWGYVPRQVDRAELMDDPSVTALELHRVYHELEVINRWLGGHGISVEGVRRLVPSGPVSVLDVGFGGGDFAEVLVEWSKRTGRQIRYLGIEQSPVAVDYARSRVKHPHVHFEQRDLFEVEDRPLREEERFDVVHMSLTLHHFPGESAVRAMKAMAGWARVGVLVNDLQRHFLPYASIKLLTSLFSRSRLVRFDAPLSVNRGYTRRELTDICQTSGLRADVWWRPMFRWMVLARPERL